MPGQKIVIYGIRGFAREVHQLVADLVATGAPIACKGFLVDCEYFETDTIHGLPVFGDARWLAGRGDVSVVIAIGDTAARRRIVQEIIDVGRMNFATLTHPRAYIGPSVVMGMGTIANVGAIASVDITIGAHSQLHSGCTIGHDTVIGDFVTVAPGANVSGRVVIGEGVFIGAGAIIIPDIKIGCWSTIGAGAVVTRDVPENATVVGVPARVITLHAPGWHLRRKNKGE